jgi:Lsr2
MAQNVTVVLIDDIDQSEAAETVRFGVDGTAYEIDLSAEHASELRSMVGRYIKVARRKQSAPSRARQQPLSRPRTQMDREQSRRIRSWAMERGLLSSPRGRIPQHVADEYEATMRVASVPFRSPGTAEPAPKSKSNGGATRKPRRRGPRAAQDDPGATESVPAAQAQVRGGEQGLTDRERQELRTIADTAKPRQNLVAGRLRTKGLVDRDSAGNWWLTDAGRRELVPA